MADSTQPTLIEAGRCASGPSAFLIPVTVEEARLIVLALDLLSLGDDDNADAIARLIARYEPATARPQDASVVRDDA